jgi:hypothetical protein
MRVFFNTNILLDQLDDQRMGQPDILELEECLKKRKAVFLCSCHSLRHPDLPMKAMDPGAQARKTIDPDQSFLQPNGLVHKSLGQRPRWVEKAFRRLKACCILQ